LLNSVNEHVDQLEKESILKKADILHLIIKRGGDFQPIVRDYEYSREKLQAIDDARYGAVHRLQFREGVADVDGTVDYFRRTVLYFIELPNFRYGLRVDPTVSTNGDSGSTDNGKKSTAKNRETTAGRIGRIDHATIGLFSES